MLFRSNKTNLISFGLIAIVSLILLVDVLEDIASAITWFHVLSEVLIVGLIAMGIATLWRENQAYQSEVTFLAKDVLAAREEATRYREEAKEYMRGLSISIYKQFQRWGLTQAESEIGLLLLKGYSLKEIASIRKTTPRTVRQQTIGIYKKAGIGGRAELSAFFLEDILLPMDQR